MEQEFANHSESIETSVESTETPIETSPAPEGTEQPVTTQEPPKGITVKYNKEERFIPEEEIQTWVQKGLNNDKLQEKAKQAEAYQKNLDRIAKYYNFESHDEYMKALEKAEHDRQIEEEAQRLGVDPSVIKEYVQPLNQKLQTYEQKLAEIERQEAVRAIDAQVNELKGKYEDFGKYESQVFDIAMNKGYSLEDAYIIASHHDKLQSTKTQAEQEAIQKLQQNAATSTGPLGKDSPDEQFGYMSMTPAERKAYRQKVKNGG